MRLSPDTHRRLAELAAALSIVNQTIDLLRTEAPDVAYDARLCSKLIDQEDAARPLLAAILLLCGSDVIKRIEALRAGSAA